MKKHIKNDIIIIGAGPSGLSAAKEFIDNDTTVSIIEKNNKVGGLARTIKYKDCSYDIEIVSSNIKDDFILIGSYSNRILSPSTFSFWASALGCNPKNSKVYAWQYWYDSIHRNIKLPNEQN